MLGIAAEVIDWSEGAGHVHATGERWKAVGPGDLFPGEAVRVEAMTGLTLTVSRAAAPGRHARAAGDGREGWSR
jgi:membrane-bound serine protease (ClpP class)